MIFIKARESTLKEKPKETVAERYNRERREELSRLAIETKMQRYDEILGKHYTIGGFRC